LTNYTDNNLSPPASLPNVGIYLNPEFNAVSSTQSIISNNSIVQNPLITTAGVANIVFYDRAIACYNNANIYGNTITGVVNDSTKPMVYLFSNNNGPSISFTNNILTRDIYSIQAYVASGGISATTPNSGIITNNIFDSQFVDAGNSIENPGENIPANWIFQRNKNQVAYASIPTGDLANLSYYDGYYQNSTSYGGFWVGATTNYTRQQVFGIGSTSVNMLAVTASTTALNIILLGDISRYLPTGVIPLYSVMGISMDSGTVNTDVGVVNNSQYQIWTDKSPQFTVSGAPNFAGTLADNISNDNNTQSLLFSSNQINISALALANPSIFTTTTQYMYADLTTSGVFTTSPNMKLNARIFGRLNSALDLPTLHIFLSPLLIKYIW
jgi:hypothetical protein